MSRLVANEALRDELLDLLNGLKVARDKMEHGDADGGKLVLDQVGTALSNTINSLTVIRA